MLNDELYDQGVSVCIGIPVFNDAYYVKLLLDCIRDYTLYRHYRVVVVDDGSPDTKVTKALTEICATYNAQLIVHPENRGVAASWNSAAKVGVETGCEVLAFLNNDLLVPPHWLTCAVYALLSNHVGDRIGSVFWAPIQPPAQGVRDLLAVMAPILWNTTFGFGPVAPAQDKAFPEMGWGAYSAGRKLFPNGSGFATLTETYQGVGPFDEKFRSFFEESDFGVRCGMAGKFALRLPWPRTYHACSRTFSEQAGHIDTSVRMQESREHFIRKWDIPKEGHPFSYTKERYLRPLPKATVSVLVPHGTDHVDTNYPEQSKVGCARTHKLRRLCTIL